MDLGNFHIGFGGTPEAASGALGAKLRAIQAVRTAAQQAQQLADQQRQESFKNMLDLMSKGAVPAMNETGGKLTLDPSGNPVGALGHREPNPAAQGKGQTVEEPVTGNKFYIPTPEEKAAGTLDDTNSFTLPDALAKQAGMKPGTRLPLKEAGSLKELLEMANPKPAPEKAHTKRVDTQSFNVPAIIDEATGEVTPLKLGAGVSPAQEPAKAPKRENLDDWVRIAADPSSSPQEKARAQASIDLYNKSRPRPQAELDAADRFAQREADRKQAVIDRAQKTIDALQAKEQQQHALRMGYGGALATPNGQRVIDPQDRKEYTMTDARRAAYQRKFDAATNMVGVLQDQQRKLHARYSGEGAPQQGQVARRDNGTVQGAAPAAQPSGPPTRAGQTQQAKSRGKLTDARIAQSYMKRAGGDKAKARQLAKADGWEL